MAAEASAVPRTGADIRSGDIVRVIDCRDQICPKPVFMTKSALSELKLGEELEVIVNDDTAKQNVLRYCWNHGQTILRSHSEGVDFHLVVQKSPEKSVDKPMPVVGPCGTRWDQT